MNYFYLTFYLRYVLIYFKIDMNSNFIVELNDIVAVKISDGGASRKDIKREGHIYHIKLTVTLQFTLYIKPLAWLQRTNRPKRA